MTGLGLLALGFYGVYAIEHLLQGHPEDLLWCCHLASVWVGIGLIRRHASITAVGPLWLSLGIPFWILYLLGGGEWDLPSALTHVGGMTLGLVGVRRLGMPRGTWWRAWLALLALGGVSHLATPPAGNVNLAHGVWEGWETTFPDYHLYAVLIVSTAAATFWVAETGIRRWVGGASETRFGPGLPGRALEQENPHGISELPE